jgi:hypothetical protein
MKVPVLSHSGMPGGAIISGKGDTECAATNTEVKASNAHPPEVREADCCLTNQIMIASARTSVGNARPTAHVTPPSGFPSAEALLAAGGSDKTAQKVLVGLL